MAGKVIISPNPIKSAERIDFNGNIIDPRTKQILVPKEEEYVSPPTPPTPVMPPEAPQATIVQEQPKDDATSIQEQILRAEANLAKLKEAKKAKIEEMEEQLKKLKEN